MKVAGYGRVSTSDQIEGTSPQAQKDAVTVECERFGYELYKFYSDEGFSGFSISNRPGLKKLLQDAKASKFDAVMFTKLDRLGRNLRELLNTWKLFEDRGIATPVGQHCQRVGLTSGPDDINGGERGIRTLGAPFGTHSLSRRAPSANSAISPKSISGFPGHPFGPFPMSQKELDSGGGSI